jgi:HEPN domain-containing protein
MNETDALLVKAKRYLRSAKLLLQDGDYETASAMSDEDAREVLGCAREFSGEVARWLDEVQK